jgi:hypothetical protein
VINKHKNISGDSVFLRWPLAFFITMTITLYLVFSAYPEAATDSGSVDPELDELYEQLTQTKAIGVFAKLSIKNNVTRLHKSLAVYHQGDRPPSLEELRERYDLMVQEILILVQEKDPELARIIHEARLLLWSYLSDPEKYKYI